LARAAIGVVKHVDIRIATGDQGRDSDDAV
jgi:hypothetical protein